MKRIRIEYEVYCPDCGWKGYEESAANYRDDDYTEYLCPQCRADVEWFEDGED